MSKFYCQRRWFHLGSVPIYYHEDGSVDIELTLRDLLLLHELAEMQQPDMFSAFKNCLVYEDSDED